MTRTCGEPWGIEFATALFDGLMTCKNACTFCFMDMLPAGMRPALYARDDDYRLSFLSGNFVTLTNLTEADVQRIVALRLSPLHVSLHAVNPAVRRRLMGANHARGIEALEQLLAAGIEVHAQIVLMPGINDGAELERTLDYCEAQAGVVSVGVVPYGYTRFARVREGFGTEQARRVIEQCASRSAKVQLADEFFLLAGGALVSAGGGALPPASYYGEFPQFEDGIGMLRSFIDDWTKLVQDEEAGEWGAALAAVPTGVGIAGQALGDEGQALGDGGAVFTQPVLVTGTAFAPILRELTEPFDCKVVAVTNDFFGGNVDVAGLLTGRDLIEQLPAQLAASDTPVLIPSVMLNDDGLTLDDMSAAELAAALKRQVDVVPCSAQDLFARLAHRRRPDYVPEHAPCA